MVTQTERRINTRSAIVEAAFNAYKKSGSTDIALEAIAKNAGVTKGSVHYHFKNRVGLIKEVAIWVFQNIEQADESEPPSKTKSKKSIGPAVNYVQTLLRGAATPTGRVLYNVGDELARVGELKDVDPYRYLCVRLQSLGVTGSVGVLAAAITQMGRQLAYGLAPASEIDDMVASLSIGGKLAGGSVKSRKS